MRKIKLRGKVVSLPEIFRAKEKLRKKEAKRSFEEKIESLAEMIRVNEEFKKIRERAGKK